MRVTLPGVAIAAIIGAVLVLGADKADGYRLRHHPADQSKTAELANAPAGGLRAASQSAGMDEKTGGGRQANPATALRQDAQQKAPQAGAKSPEQGPVRSQTGLEPAGAPPKAGNPPLPQSAASAPPAPSARQ